MDQVMLGGPSVKQSIRGIDCSDGRHGQGFRLIALQPLAGFDPQVQFQLAVDAIDAFVVPRMALHVAQMQETQPEPPSLAGICQTDKQIGDLFVLGP